MVRQSCFWKGSSQERGMMGGDGRNQLACKIEDGR